MPAPAPAPALAAAPSEGDPLGDLEAELGALEAEARLAPGQPPPAGARGGGKRVAARGGDLERVPVTGALAAADGGSLRCPHCASADLGRNGTDRYGQRMICRSCRHTFGVGRPCTTKGCSGRMVKLPGQHVRRSNGLERWGCEQCDVEEEIALPSNTTGKKKGKSLKGLKLKGPKQPVPRGGGARGRGWVGRPLSRRPQRLKKHRAPSRPRSQDSGSRPPSSSPL